jgi:hypothetical protein
VKLAGILIGLALEPRKQPRVGLDPHPLRPLNRSTKHACIYYYHKKKSMSVRVRCHNAAALTQLFRVGVCA